MPRDPSTYLQLVYSRDDGKRGRTAQGRNPFFETPADEMRAIASCLAYLHGQVVKLDLRLPAHLIGAAVESVLQEISRAQHDEVS